METIHTVWRSATLAQVCVCVWVSDVAVVFEHLWQNCWAVDGVCVCVCVVKQLKYSYFRAVSHRVSRFTPSHQWWGIWCGIPHNTHTHTHFLNCGRNYCSCCIVCVCVCFAGGLVLYEYMNKKKVFNLNVWRCLCLDVCVCVCVCVCVWRHVFCHFSMQTGGCVFTQHISVCISHTAVC